MCQRSDHVQEYLNPIFKDFVSWIRFWQLCYKNFKITFCGTDESPVYALQKSTSEKRSTCPFIIQKWIVSKKKNTINCSMNSTKTYLVTIHFEMLEIYFSVVSVDLWANSGKKCFHGYTQSCIVVGTKQELVLANSTAKIRKHVHYPQELLIFVHDRAGLVVFNRQSGLIGTIISQYIPSVR